MNSTGNLQSSEAFSSHPPQTALDRLLKRIFSTEEFPTISRYIVEINQKLAVNPDESNATDLANIILKDHALTSKLLKMVNSAFYGLAAGKVSTITRAVVVLGYENVRLATLSLALFEHFKGKANARPLKEAVIGSFWSGMMARELATMHGGTDPEEAFVCAMMSHLGKLVTIYYLPEEYRKIRTLINDEGFNETKAARSVCGVTYDELGAAVARQWNFPEQICDAMQPLSKERLQDKKKPPTPLKLITSFVKEIGATIDTPSLLTTQKNIKTQIKTYEPHLAVSTKAFKTLIKDSLDRVYEHAHALSLNVSQSAFLGRLSAIYDPQHKLAPAPAEQETTDGQVDELFHLTDDDQLKAGVRRPASRNPKDIIMDGIQELSQIMMNDYDIDTIAVMSLEVLYRALDFHRALMFIKSGNTNIMEVRFGYGQNCQQLTGRLNFDWGKGRDLFSLSIRVGKDLIVADSYDDKMMPLLPAWYRKQIDAPSFIFLPIMLQKVCVGALYADRDTQGLPVSETEHRYLGMLRNQLVLSIKYKQRESS